MCEIVAKDIDFPIYRKDIVNLKEMPQVKGDIVVHIDGSWEFISQDDKYWIASHIERILGGFKIVNEITGHSS